MTSSESAIQFLIVSLTFTVLIVTTIELLYLSDTILHGFDSGLLTSLIALDFSRLITFFTVDHEF